ncbi:hypothetical protein MP228_010219 [Amoeboaphelidium protococcarum]|nr:hypothetical protein MP228_010219 [Amoeboaphelidium protococcarum]
MWQMYLLLFFLLPVSVVKLTPKIPNAQRKSSKQHLNVMLPENTNPLLYKSMLLLKYVLKCIVLAQISLITNLATLAMGVPCRLGIFGLQPENLNSYAGKLYYNLCRVLLDVRVQVEGAEFLPNVEQNPSDKTVLIANHQSVLDLITMASIWIPRSVVIIKDVLKYYPFFGQHMWLAGNIFIQRPGKKSALINSTLSLEEVKERAKLVMNEAALKMVEKNVNIFLFPEGTRHSYNEPLPNSGSKQVPDLPQMLPFKRGAFQLAASAKCSVTPVVISDYTPIFSSSFQSGFWFYDDAVIKVRILKPILVDDQNLDSVRSQCQDLMQSNLIEMSRLDESSK